MAKLTERELELRSMKEARFGGSSATSPPEKVLPKLTRRAGVAPKAGAPAAAAVSPPHDPGEKLAGGRRGREVIMPPDPAAFCPVCEARRLKEAARVKRWRDKQKEGA